MFTYSIASIDDIELLFQKRLKERNLDPCYKHSLENYFDDFVSGKSILFVVKKGEEPIGSINLEFCELADIASWYVSGKKYCYLSTFKIEKRYEGQGHISKLTKKAEDIARKLGYQHAIIACEETNQRVKSIYNHFGYTEVVAQKQERGHSIVYLGKQLGDGNWKHNEVPYVSIVMPVYNSSNVLCDTINCILHQTYTNFELIIVDDGSIDSTLQLISDMTQEDQRVKIIKQAHLGAGIARNNGMKEATGKYILFLDSDDLFLPNMLEVLVNTAETYESDIVTFEFASFRDNPSNYVSAPCLYDGLENRLYSSLELKNNIFQKTIAAAWNKFFRRSYLKDCGLEFQNLPFFNDEYFSRMALIQSDRILYIKDKLLFYRLNSPNNIHSAKDGSLLFSSVIDALYDTMEKKNLLSTFTESFSIYFADVIYRALSRAGTKELFVPIFTECKDLFNRCKCGVNLSYLSDDKKNVLEYVSSGNVEATYEFVNRLSNLSKRV